jgi:hypothetical protein
MAVTTVKVVAEVPPRGQGETEARPRPEPKATRIRVVAIATMAPAKMAGQDAAETNDSIGRLVEAV